MIRIKGPRIHPRDFLGVGRRFSRTSHQFRAPAKAHKESETREGKETLDWYDNVQVYRGDLA